MKYTDQEYINGLSSKDKSAWETKLFHQYSWLVDTHKDRSKNQEELINAYADSIMVFLDNFNSGIFKRESKIETYIYSIFKNKYNGALRKQNTRKYTVHKTEIIDHFYNLSDSAKNILESLISKEMIASVQQGLENLNSNCKELLMARFAEELPAKVIAKQLGYKSEGTVRTTQHRCLEKLKKEIEKSTINERGINI